MKIFVDIDPVAIQIGSFPVYWYGIMYLIGFLCFWWLGKLRSRQSDGLWTEEQVSDLMFYGILGVILGGRIGYLLFYDLQNVIADPVRIIQIRQGGMSFHGGLLGVILAMFWWGRRQGKRFFEVADFVAPLSAPGLLFGRLGNFIGGELWGRHTDAPWGMIFPRAIESNLNPEQLHQQYLAGALDHEARHPSQLYEAALEGLVLFVIVWMFTRKPKPMMAASGLFLLGYGVFRFIIEFFREPDSHLEFIALGWLTMGQILSMPLILFGLGLMVAAYRRSNRLETA